MKKMIALLLALALLSGCSTPDDNYNVLQVKPVPVQQITVQFTLPFNQNEPISRCMASLAADYSAENNVTVVVQYGDAQEQQLLTELLSADRASLYLLPSEYILRFGGQGYLTPIDSKPEQFYPDAAAYCRINNETFAIPYLGSPLLLLCNEELIEQAGATMPQSWADVLAVCNKVAKETEQSGLAGIGAQCASLGDIMLMLTQHSGEKLVARWGGVDQMNLQSKQIKSGVNFYLELLKTDKTEEYAQNDRQRASNVLLSGAAAVAFAKPETLRMAQIKGVPLRAASLPEDTKSPMEMYGLAVPQETSEEQKHAAQAFAAWLGEPQQLDRVLSAQYEGCEQGSSFLLPLANCAESLSFYTDHPEYRPFEKQLGYMLKPNDNSKLHQIKEKALIPALHAIITKQSTIDEALAEAQKKGNQILKN